MPVPIGWNERYWLENEWWQAQQKARSFNEGLGEDEIATEADKQEDEPAQQPELTWTQRTHKQMRCDFEEEVRGS